MRDDANRLLVSGLVILPPPDVADSIKALRQQLPPETRVAGPPHITVLYPFVSPGTVAGGADPAILDETIRALTDLCAEVAPFAITLGHFDTFPGDEAFSGGVLYLAPQDPAPIVALYRRIRAAFPDYLAYGGEYGDVLKPHMTLAVFRTGEARESAPRPDFAPLAFQVEALHLIYVDEDFLEPWTFAATIPLGGG